MPDHPGATPGDFAFQTSDQASGASQRMQQSYGHYNGERDTNAPGAAEPSSQTADHDPSMRFADFSAQQQQVAPGFTGFGFSPTAPLGWDWSQSIDFADFTNQYEPQGELVQEFQNQSVSTNDFSIPLPVATAATAYQTFPQLQNTPPATSSAQAQTRTQISPPLPPRPTQPRPVVQTGMKRKGESEPNSAASQSASNVTPYNPHKRHNKSRQSSDASVTSPVVAVATDARPPPLVMTRSAPEIPTQSAAQENNQVERRKEPSKGTGPQGRVIDVSKPRKVIEAPGGLDILPAGKVFPIQIGSELFRLSGASISSDGKLRFENPIKDIIS